MACNRCDESRTASYNFCMFCREPLNSCADCKRTREEGFSFYPTCGRPLIKSQKPPGTLSMICVYITLVVVILLIAELIIMFAGVLETWTTAKKLSMSVLVLKPELVVVGKISGTVLSVFWIVLVLCITMSVTWLSLQTIPSLRKRGIERIEAFQQTPFYWVGTLLCTSMLLNVIIALFQLDSVGNTVDVPVGPVPETLLFMADAAVWEEVITRMAFIGVPMVMLALCHLRKDFWKYLLGGFGMSRLSIVLILVSALVFGFGHLSVWGFWKVLPTAITGIALGYLYVRFGIHVSITFHFLIDYMATLIDGPTAIFMSLIMILIIIAGIPCLLDIFRRLRILPEALHKMPAVIPPD